MIRHWVLAAAFVAGTIMCIRDLMKKNTADMSDEHRQLYKDHNILLLRLFAAAAYEHIADIISAS